MLLPKTVLPAALEREYVIVFDTTDVVNKGERLPEPVIAPLADELMTYGLPAVPNPLTVTFVPAVTRPVILDM